MSLQVASVDRLVRASAQAFAGRTLLVDAETGEEVRFAEMDRRVSRAALVLAGLGVRKGDTVSLFLRNGPAFFPPWLGAIRLGAVANPINLGLEGNVARVAYMLEKARAKVLAYERAFSNMAREVRKSLPAVRLVSVDGGDGPQDIDWAAATASVPGEAPEVPVRPDDPFQMIFTSGTTGLPKAVVQRHEMLTDAFVLAEHFGYRAGDTAMCVLPLFHVNAQYTSFFPALGLGARLVLFEKFSASRFWITIGRYGVDHVSVVPSLLTRLMAAGIPADRTMWKTLRFIVCGAAPLSVELQASFSKATAIPVPNGWGMTETGCWGCHSDPGRIVPGAIGRPLPVNEMRVVDPQTGHPRPPGVPGTLLVRGVNVFREYFDAPEATAKAFRFGDGWFDTGDDASVDAEGTFFFVGRGSVDTGKVDGEFVNFLSLDERLWGHPALQEVCCVGVPDAVRGQAVAACVVPKPGQRADAADIADFCRKAGFAKYELPRHVLVVPEIPKGDTGKPQRRIMAERAAAMLAAAKGGAP